MGHAWERGESSSLGGRKERVGRGWGQAREEVEEGVEREKKKSRRVEVFDWHFLKSSLVGKLKLHINRRRELG